MEVAESEEMIWVISGISLQGPLKPVKIRRPEGSEEHHEKPGMSTPRDEEARISERLVCPPAPKKPRPSLRCNPDGIELFSPPDQLESVFIRRVERAQ